MRARVKAAPRQIKGPVRVVVATGWKSLKPSVISKERYRDIDEAIDCIGSARLVLAKKSLLVHYGFGGTECDSGYHRTYTFFDRDDVEIPAHVVLADADAVERERVRRWAGYRWRDLDRPIWSYFRNGPVPGIHNGPLYGSNYKRSGTFNEVRAAVELETDEDALAVGIRVMGRRSRSNIGDNDWDGVWSMKAHDRSWKRHRATQWKTSPNG